MRGTAHNPDIFFQARETVNPFYAARARHRRRARWTRFAALTGRHTGCSTTTGAPDAERVIVLMGSGAETARETVEALRRARRERGRAPGSALSAVLGRRTSSPRCRRRVRALAVLEQTKEPGATGEPLYLDVVTALAAAHRPNGERADACRASSADATGSRRKDFTPAMVKAVLDELAQGRAEERLHGRHHRRRRRIPASTSIRASPSTRRDVMRAVFYGLGADGTVGANKNTRQDHRRGRRPLRAGLFRLRLAQIGRADDLAPALRAASRSTRLT